MQEFLNSTVGTICYSVVLFGLGALVGKPLFAWLNSKAPWSNS
jgi:hypothetical protein